MIPEEKMTPSQAQPDRGCGDEGAVALVDTIADLILQHCQSDRGTDLIGDAPAAARAIVQALCAHCAGTGRLLIEGDPNRRRGPCPFCQTEA